MTQTAELFTLDMLGRFIGWASHLCWWDFHILVLFHMFLWYDVLNSQSFASCISFCFLMQGITLILLVIHTFFQISYEGYHLYWRNPLNWLKVLPSIHILYRVDFFEVPKSKKLTTQVICFFIFIFVQTRSFLFVR